MKRILLAFCLVMLAVSGKAQIVNNSGSTKADSISIPFFALDSAGNMVNLTTNDSVWIHVYYPSGALAFRDSLAFNGTKITSQANNGFTTYSWKEAVATIDGTPGDGLYSYLVVAKDNTGAALLTPHRGFFQLYQAKDFNTWATFLTDSIQVMLDSVQLLDEKYTSLRDSINLVHIETNNLNGGTLLVTTDNIGINWGDITNPTTTQNLTGTSILDVTDSVIIDGSSLQNTADAISFVTIMDNAIDAGAIQTEAITAGKFALDAITSSTIANNAIDSGAIASNALHPLALSANTVTEILDSAEARPLDVNVKQISDDATAANNLETMLDGTGGQTFSLGRLKIVASSDDTAFIARGAGSGMGLYIQGGSTGQGGIIYGGSISGSGLLIQSIAGSTHGLDLAGTGSGYGLLATGTGTGFGAYFVGGAGADGIRAAGGTTGSGMSFRGGSTGGSGIQAVGGATSGDALSLSKTSGNYITAGAIDSAALNLNTLYKFWAYNDSTALDLENQAVKWLKNNLAGAGGGLDSATTSRILHRIAWGTSKSAGSDSSTQAERDVTATASVADSLLATVPYIRALAAKEGVISKKIRFIDDSGDNSNGLTPATAWTDFSKVKDSTNTIYWVLPGIYVNAKCQINRSGVYVISVEGMGTARLRNADDTLNANTIMQINSDSAQAIRDIKVIGLDFAYKVSFTTTPPDPDFQAAIWVRDSVSFCEISNNFFQVDSAFKTLAINDIKVEYLWVHDNWFPKNRTHAIDAGSDYSLYENNYIFDTRDHAGGNSGAFTIEPIQIISTGKHNIIKNNYITSGSVLIRMQGDTNLVADNYLGKTTIADDREMLGFSLGAGNTWAGNWGRGNFYDTTGLVSGADTTERRSLTVPADLGRLRINTKSIGGFVDSNKTEQGGIAGATIPFYVYVIDTSGTDDTISIAGLTLYDATGVAKDGGPTTSAGYLQFTVTSGNWSVAGASTGYHFDDSTYNVTAWDTVAIYGYDQTPGTPPVSKTCLVSVYVKNSDGTPAEGVAVNAYLARNNAVDSTGSPVLSQMQAGTTDSDGLAQFTCIWSSYLIPETDWWFVSPETGNLSKEVTVPRQSTYTVDFSQ